MFGGQAQKKNEILASEKCILVDYRDDFTRDNRVNKKYLRSDSGSRGIVCFSLFKVI